MKIHERLTETHRAVKQIRSVRAQVEEWEKRAPAASADAAPTQQTIQVFDDLSARIQAQLALLQQILAKDIAAFAELVDQAGVPALAART